MIANDCTHPKLTVEFVQGEIEKCARFWDSHWSFMTCPDCGWEGYPEVNDDGDAVEFRDEPKGAGA